MDNKPLVSIIIPFYNAEKYLKRCIESIVSQDYENIEILTVDDGSEDGSLQLLKDCAQKDGRIRLLAAAHQGVAAARNRGLSEASGEYIMFVDADDWIKAGIIGHMMELFLNSDADMVTCEIKHNAVPGEDLPKYKEGSSIYTKEEYKRIFFRIGGNQYVHYPVAKIYKKSLLPNPLYPPGIRVGEDVLGTYRAICRAEKIVRLNECGYFYFYSGESTTASFGEKDFDLLTVWDMMVKESEGMIADSTYALLGRKRMNFCLLFRLLTEVSLTERKEKYSGQIRKLRNDLRLCEKDLYDAPIVRSRKLLIFLLCHFYPVMSFLGNIYVKLNR